MELLNQPSNLAAFSVIGIAFTTFMIGIGFGGMIGRAVQRRFDDWFYRDGPRPWWV